MVSCSNPDYVIEEGPRPSCVDPKMHLGKALSQNNWEAIYKDIEKYPLDGISKGSAKSQIVEKLGSYGIRS